MKGSHPRSDSSAQEIIIAKLSKKLRQRGIKVASVVSRCEQLDRNHDYCIHSEDMFEILVSLLGRDMFTMREMHHLACALGNTRGVGQVNYGRLNEVLGAHGGKPSDERENWHDDIEQREDTRWASKKGSVGEWLQNSACPAEIKNFKRFIACLEDFERSSGMKCVNTEDGFIVPLGPDLKTSIKFFMT
jgi:hypothetical protein